MNYYNDNDPKAAAWLRELIAANLIPPGEVDERSIEDVTKSDLQGYTQVHMFAGIGGWAEALRIAGWTADRPVWTGSCPCQPFSMAGKQRGEKDPRNLWAEFRRLIYECRPAIVFGEQVASPLGRRWLSGVRTEMETLGYAVGAADLCAAGVGAPHIRQRLYWVADSNGNGWGRRRLVASVAKQSHEAHARHNCWDDSIWMSDDKGESRRFPRGYERMADGIFKASSLGRGYGNAIVPQVAAEFIRAYMEI